jgi:hypothetical protein
MTPAPGTPTPAIPTACTWGWTTALRFVDEPGRQPDLAHLRTLAPRLTPDARRAILEIKQACEDRGLSVRGFDVYRSVLDDHVRTPEQFEAWRTRPEA